MDEKYVSQKKGKRRKIMPIVATHLLKQNILYYGRGYLIDQQPTSSTKFVRNRWDVSSIVTDKSIQVCDFFTI